MPFVSSDPDAWMRPYYEAIAWREGFALLPIPIQFATLVNVIAEDHPSKAAKLREIDDLPSQRAILGSLTRIVYPRPAQREIELWRLVKDSRELRCIARYLPTGIDLRLMEGDEFRRTQLLREGPAVQGVAEDWRSSCAAQDGLDRGEDWADRATHSSPRKEINMRILALAAITVLCGGTVLAQTPERDAGAALLLDDVSAKLRNELQAIHDRWFQAFDAGDGAAMDAVEVDNLVLVMPDGSVWKKSGPRAGKQPKRDGVPQRSLNDVTVRQFGDTAILTGILRNTTATDTENGGTTVVFVRRGGTWRIASVHWSPGKRGK